MAVLRPGQAGGQRQVVVDHLVAQLLVKAEQRPAVAAKGIVHQPGNETPLRVAGAVVETVARPRMNRRRMLAHLAQQYVEDGHAGILGEDQVALVGQRQRADACGGLVQAHGFALGR
ncbi:hypothetical protein D3C81_1134870 [compost metagenome]